MPWLLAAPAHQQPWYWQCRKGRPLPCVRISPTFVISMWSPVVTNLHTHHTFVRCKARKYASSSPITRIHHSSPLLFLLILLLVIILIIIIILSHCFINLVFLALLHLYFLVIIITNIIVTLVIIIIAMVMSLLPSSLWSSSSYYFIICSTVTNTITAFAMQYQCIMYGHLMK